jgi:hypothetical protein
VKPSWFKPCHTWPRHSGDWRKPPAMSNFPSGLCSDGRHISISDLEGHGTSNLGAKLPGTVIVNIDNRHHRIASHIKR